MVSETLTVNIPDFSVPGFPEEDEEEEYEEGGEIFASNQREPTQTGKTVAESAQVTTAVTLGASAGSMMIAGDPGIFMK